ncbi:hypothetical protein [Streptomyces otsuchiensis]|uniref:hypothetical protein n=1 Tax=Streptomyces otsuchiensis TaxID=2681388 RepID=UPI00102FD66E|nr:hypothetical protein [Streptomyces otsuchiensis]
MKRHVLVPVVAVATVGLLLTGCSSGDAEPDDDIAGVDTSEPADADEDEPADDDEQSGDDEPDDGIDRPEIELPEDLENVFEPVDTTVPDERAVLADQERFVNAVDEAITSGELDRPALQFYADGEAYLTAVDYVTSFHADGYTISGGVRYYDRSVTLREDGVATTSYCIDYRDSFMVDTSSDEKHALDDRQGYGTSRLERNDDGVWQTVSESVSVADGEC